MGVACERRWERAGQEEEEVELWKTGEGLKEEVVGDDRSGGLRGRSKFGPRLAGKQTEWGYRIWLLSLTHCHVLGENISPLFIFCKAYLKIGFIFFMDFDWQLIQLYGSLM